MSVSPFVPTALIGLGRTEAEALTVEMGFAAVANPHPSGDAVLQATAAASSAGGSFSGPAGRYDLVVGYVDETDGASTLEVVVDGVVVDSFVWDGAFGDATVTPAGLAEREVAGVALAPGSTIVLRGARDGGEPLRTDYVEVAPAGVAGPFVVEAEDLAIVRGFAVRSNPNASGDAFLQATGRGEARASYAVEEAGTFDLTVGYFDETDGASSLEVRVNGATVDAFRWDGAGGTRLASRESRAERTIEDLALAAGDTVELVGFSDGGEPLRTDFLRFVPVAAPPPPPFGPTPDLWYVDADGDVIVALNDGTASFTTVDTGIDVLGGQVLEADVDGDGDADFLRVSVTSTAAAVDRPDFGSDFDVTVETTIFVNDGSAGFDQASSSTTSFVQATFGGAPGFALLDAAQVAGDGAVDYAAAFEGFDPIVVFVNDGAGGFAAVPQPGGESSDVDGSVGRFADLNGDEAPDLVAGVNGAGSVAALVVLSNLDDGTGAFLPVFSSTRLDAVEDLALVDLDGGNDGGDALADRLDLLIGGDDVEADAIDARLNPGSGVPAAPADAVQDVVSGVFEAADLDGDGLIEVVTGRGTPDFDPAPSDGLVVFEFDPSGPTPGFSVQSSDPGLAGEVLAAADYDLDGDVDVILFRDGAAEVLRNDGTGAFASGGVVLADAGAEAARTAFFDDGAAALLV